MPQKKSSHIAFLVFILSALPAFNFMLNHFFVTGALVLDCAWFAYLYSNAQGWPMNNLPVREWMGTYFNVHMALIFYLTSFLYSGINLIVPLHNGVYSAILHGTWFGIIGLSAFRLMTRDSDKKFLIIPAVLLAVAVSYNGVSLSTFNDPHYEIVIPAMQVLFFMLFFQNRILCASLALLFGLLAREDAGLHYFGLFFLLTLCLLFFDKDKEYRKETLYFAAFGILCLFYSLLIIFYQKTLYPNAQHLEDLYLGKPLFSHISQDFIDERLKIYWVDRRFLWVPLLLSLVFSLIRLNPVLSIGTLAVLPWCLFSFCAKVIGPGTMESYYCFPLLIAIFWPLIANVLNEKSRIRPVSRIIDRWLIPAAIILSSIIFFPGSQHMLNNRPWQNFDFKWVFKASTNFSSLERFLESNKDIHVIYGEYVSALKNDTLTHETWLRGLIWVLKEDVFPYDKLKQYDTVIHSPYTWFEIEVIAKLVKGLTLNHSCRIDGTDLIVYSKYDNLAVCSPMNSN